MLRKAVLAIIGAVIVIAACVYAAFQLSPWPSALLIRHAFAENAAEVAASIEPLVPKDISAQRALSYAPDDPDALFDVFMPAGAQGPLPAVIWVHGGGFIGGSRTDISGYLQVLAARGFVTVAIDYSLAPGARFPTPLRQTNAALTHILTNAGRFNIDPRRIFLAGDSAGAQIVAQTALIISDADYARRMAIEPGLARDSVRGLLLYCGGPYDPATINFSGPFTDFMRTVVWSYIGTRDPRDARIGQMAVTPYVTAAYPPVFISVGNADPLESQSRALAEALRAKGVEVDALFFPADHQPPLEHEYQMLLATAAGRLAFDRSVAFLKAHAN
jgi:acetyl esterase